MAHQFNRRLSQNKAAAVERTINSAALQDQLVRSLNLNPVRRSVAAPMRRNVNSTTSTASTARWACDSCTLVNPANSTHCEACNAPYESNRNTGALPYSAPPTLAQIRGLAPAPPPKLTDSEWIDVEMSALTRGDVTGNCSICFCDFNSGDQVILSCSHTFHGTCIASFERFLRTKERTCPMCRHASYQKKTTDVGAAMHRLNCARMMQKVIRGGLKRRRYKVLLREHYKRNEKGAVDDGRRRDFYAHELSGLGDALTKNVDEREDSIEELFREFDANLAVSRYIMADNGEGAAAAQPPPQHVQPKAVKVAAAKLTMMEWCSVWSRALTRCNGVHECGICLSACNFKSVVPSLLSSSSSSSSSPPRPPGTTSPRSDVKEGQYLLSCSHLFHSKCINAFEAFNIYEGVNLCPICRADYQKVDVEEVLGMEMFQRYGDGGYLQKEKVGS
jgi:hypothetical protein